MTNEILMIPRVEIINLWPNCSKFKVGDILTNFKGFYRIWGKVKSIPASEVDKNNHIFNPLEWYEKREEKDMPMYVKSENCKMFGVLKVTKWDGDYNRWHHLFSDDFKVGSESISIDVRHCLPATKEEYNQYILNNKK